MPPRHSAARVSWERRWPCDSGAMDSTPVCMHACSGWAWVWEESGGEGAPASARARGEAGGQGRKAHERASEGSERERGGARARLEGRGTDSRSSAEVGAGPPLIPVSSMGGMSGGRSCGQQGGGRGRGACACVWCVLGVRVWEGGVQGSAGSGAGRALPAAQQQQQRLGPPARPPTQARTHACPHAPACDPPRETWPTARAACGRYVSGGGGA